ncbi:hypothetical protein M3J09_010242 [Ascochyta lentis]
MSHAGYTNSTLTFEDVEYILELARKGVSVRYKGPEYSYVHAALRRLFFLGILECSINRGDPVVILHECLQDEQSVLDRHNRLQAKMLFRKETTHGLSEIPENFPLRRLVSRKGIVLPADGFKPIYQIADDPEKLQAAHRARMNAVAAATQLNTLSLKTPTNPAPKQYASKPGNNHDKLYDSPSPEHDFPKGNITLAEMAAFIPQSFKCWDVIDRIIWNGAKSEDIAKLINKYRVMPAGKIANNTVYMMMRGQMYKRSKDDVDYEGWTVGGHENIAKPDDFDPHSLSVTDFRRPRVFANRPDEPVDPVPFKDLADGVAVWPEHGDALDLTRCVSWCAANPEERYYYPTDFRKVLYQCLGGPATVERHHEDAQVLLRLRSVPGATNARHRLTRKLSDDETDEQEGEAVARSGKHKHSATKQDVRRRKTIAAQALSARSTRASLKRTTRTTPRNLSFSFGNMDSEDETDDEAYQGPKRAKKNKAEPRRSERTKKPVQYGDGAMMIDDEEEVDAEYKESKDKEFGDTLDERDLVDEVDVEMDD